MNNRESEVESEGDRAELRNHDAEPGPDRDAEIVEAVIRFDRAEVGEEDLVE